MSARSLRWAVLLGAALFVSAVPFSAVADPLAPGALVPALDVYVDAVIARHAVALACDKPSSLARDGLGWIQAKAVFVATLWANGFPADFVRGVKTRLDAATGGGEVDCAAEAGQDSFDTPRYEGWVKTIDRTLSGMDIAPITTPVDTEQWAEIKAAFDKELPLQKRIFDCAAATMPDLMPVTVHDWDQMLIDLEGKLTAAGLPRDEVAAVLGAAEANALWHRAAPDAMAALKQSCRDDQRWSDELFNLEFMGLASAVEKLLPDPAKNQ